LPTIRSVAYEVYIFQEDDAPAHRAHQTVELFRRETPVFTASSPITCGYPTAGSGDLNPADYRIRGVVQERVYQTPMQDVVELRHWVMNT